MTRVRLLVDGAGRPRSWVVTDGLVHRVYYASRPRWCAHSTRHYRRACLLAEVLG